MKKLFAILILFPSICLANDINNPSVITGGQGITVSGLTVTSTAEQTLVFAPGLITAVTNNIGGFTKVAKASTVDNLVASAVLFTCVGNPTVTMYECGTSATCAVPTTIGTVTLTAAGTVVASSLSSTAISAGDYIAFAITSGTCTSIDLHASAQIHSN